ncbi:MAG: bifunctional 5,10-methylenetetrahydrofolate dehydrogenase/5,10-methenyltetrahydrofolate cyclohydrolase [Parcubacteria group bacterium]|nr:bifunctional 5,10-methylenetetrahydrofolate dehydrogenase/5,10-methenyltetrahydrofolate cyclohydrolase [Parcubacteria group bacterium]
MKIIDGKKIADKILSETRKEIKKLPAQPGLAVILVGDDSASKIYVKKKEKACTEAGVHLEKFLYKKTTTNKIIEQIKKLNQQKDINGILVQLPLPKNLDTNKIINSINPKKDVDGFLPKSKVSSPTIAGVLELIKSTRKNTRNKTAVILANSNLFASPLKKLLEKEGLKVKILIKPKRQNFGADIIITAIGKPKFIKADIVKDGVIIIDVGITRVGKKIFGDVDAESLKDRLGWITPVPGGVGPMTVAMLIKNLLILSKC